MGKIKLCLEITSSTSGFADVNQYKKIYEDNLKPAASFLYSHPESKLAFFFTGLQYEMMAQKNSEIFNLLKSCISRKQVEILGGGYYNPVFPLLFPLDRTGQIENLSSKIRTHFGKRPRGITLCASAWDPSLVTSFTSCSMEYAQLDSSLIPKEKLTFTPVVMADRGKSIKILTVHRDLKPTPDEDAQKLITRIIKTVEEYSGSKIEDSIYDRYVVINFDLNWKFNTKCMEDLLNLVTTKYSDKIEFSLPGTCIKNADKFETSYIHAGISADIAKWSFEPYKETEITDKTSVNIYDFLQTYKRSQALYNRMIYVSLLVNGSQGDKVRKKSARDLLQAAQNGDAYVCRTNGILVNSQERQNAYRKLNEAEKIIREIGDFKESVTQYDYDCDGFNEYLCRMEKFNACITLCGGSIFELDVIKKSGNYADNMSRKRPMDACDDNYEKGLFIDHLFEPEEYDKFIHGKECKNGVFSGNIYKELSFNAARKEIHLETKSVFPTLNQTISLKKNYSFTSNGVMVQYIIKNESPLALKAKFAVESNFAQTVFNTENFDSYKIEVAANGQLEEKLPTSEEFFTDVSALLLTDKDNSVSFMFEPNENSQLFFTPITFMRRNTDSENLEPAGRTLSLSFAWDVDLAAGMEMEKTINLAIVPGKKRK